MNYKNKIRIKIEFFWYMNKFSYEIKKKQNSNQMKQELYSFYVQLISNERFIKIITQKKFFQSPINKCKHSE